MSKTETKSTDLSIRSTDSTNNTTSMGLDSSEEDIFLRTGKVSFHLVFAVFVVTLGSSFQFGYNIGVVNAPGHFISEWMKKSHLHLFGNELTESQQMLVFSAAISIFAIGGMLGGLLVGQAADRLGRKRSLHLNNVLSLVGGIFMCGAYYINFYPLFHVGRLIIGINAGLASGLVPMFLVELSPISLRGAFGSIPQLIVTISILVAQILGLPFIFGTAERWPLMFAFILVPTVLQSIGLFFVPESPKYTLVLRGDHDQALTDLIKFRTSLSYAKLELKTLEHEKADCSNTRIFSISKLVKSRALRWPLLLAILLMAFQQLSGINAVMFYSTQIFRQAGLVGDNAVYATIAMAALNALVSLLSVWLVDQESFGRRQLLYIGKMGMFVASVSLVTSIALNNRQIATQITPYFSVFFLLLFVFFFACGPGSIPFFYISEIFASNTKGSANSIGTATNWAFNFVVGLLFLPLNNILQEFTFLIFAVICFAGFFFVVFYLPETKGKQLDEVQDDLKRRQPKCFG